MNKESARALTFNRTRESDSVLGGTPNPLHSFSQSEQLAEANWLLEHCANEPEPFLTQLVSRSASVASLAVLLISFIVLPAYAAVHEVESVGLTVSDLDREVKFFTHVLPFKEVSRREISGPGPAQLLGLPQAQLKVAVLKLGSEKITLTEPLEKGRPIPSDSRSYDHWFQHIAIVVRDMDPAYEHLRGLKVKYVSTAPQTLPEWNKGAAGIKAFYFRDPEDHVLEIIWFPKGKGDPKWQSETDQLFLGIDHTAIVISDTDTSLAFYRDLLGMRVAGESENYGVEQEHLNQVFGARLQITALRAEKGPGIELLEYLTPSGGRALPADTKPNDLLFWRTDVAMDHLDAFASKLAEKGAKLVSNGVVNSGANQRAPEQGIIIRDPDGHALELVEERTETATSALR